MGLVMEENIAFVLQGFLNLTAKEKLRLVEAINEYFDSTERAPIRAAWEEKFAEIRNRQPAPACKCCGQ